MVGTLYWCYTFKAMKYMKDFFYRCFCSKYTPGCLLVLSLTVSFICYWMERNLSLSITQFVIGLVLGLQSALESKRMHSKVEKLTKRIDETGVKLVDNPEYVYSLVDSVDWQKGIPKPIKLELDSIKRDIANIKKNMGS